MTCRFIGINSYLNQEICFCNSCPHYKFPVSLEICTPCVKFQAKDADANKNNLFIDSILESIPPHKDGRTRKFSIENGRSIVYEKEDGIWEPPRDINGYERDPNDPWRFKSLWEPCILRQSKGIRNTSCGCINFIMTCNNPQCSVFKNRVSHTECADCPFRTPESK